MRVQIQRLTSKHLFRYMHSLSREKEEEQKEETKPATRVQQWGG